MGNTKKLPLITITPEVILAINEELEYQSILEESGRADALDHGVAGQLAALDVYSNEAKVAWTKTAGDEKALDAFRKIAAIAVRALVQHGVPRRKYIKHVEGFSYAIYINPKDFPGEVVIRAWVGGMDSADIKARCSSLEEARALIPKGLKRTVFQSDFRDYRGIVETWEDYTDNLPFLGPAKVETTNEVIRNPKNTLSESWFLQPEKKRWWKWW